MPIERMSASAAGGVIEKLLPSETERAATLDVFAQVIKHAEKLGGERWSITLKRRRVLLNAGNLRVFDISPKGLKMALDPARIDDMGKIAIDNAGVQLEGYDYQLFPSYQVGRVPVDVVAVVWPHLREAAFAAVDGAASWGKCPYRNAHSPGVLSYLAERTGIDVKVPPEPGGASSHLGELLQRSYASANLAFTPDQIASFFTGLQVKGFVLLTGISGTGKSKLAQHFIDAIGHAALSNPASDAGRIRIRTMPYMVKHGHMIVPKRIAELVEIPEAGEAGEIELHFPGGTEKVRFSHRKYASTDYLELTFRGKARDWAKSELGKIDSFFLEPVTDKNAQLVGFRIQLDAVGEMPAHAGAHRLFLSVGADWRDRTELLGFYNPVTEKYESRRFVEFLEEALDAWERKDRRPYFVILDEMNLARVEYYFADLLSVLESGRRADGLTAEAVELAYPDGLAATEAPRKRLQIPPNFFVIGTVNSDETTHAFSPKVLDRAFTIELNDVDFDLVYSDEVAPLTASERREIAQAFSVDGTYPRNDRKGAADLLEDEPQVRDRLQALSDALQPYEMHFGYRVFDEIVGFLVHANRNKLFPEGIDDAFDAAVLMKVLPKFHGSRSKLERPLLTVLRWCVRPDDDLSEADESFATLEIALAKVPTEENVTLPATAARVRRMLRALATSGFASFG
jgi:hypothetical protein